jgi:GAF domain-containing protein/HAMP domain-containing protein
MTTTQATPNHDIKQKRFKGSLAGTLVRTLLIFTFIPLALMAGVAYIRARSLLQEQAISQSQHLLATQLKIIDGEIANKESSLERLLESSDFTILTELALHANPKSNEFREIRNGMLQEFKNLNAQENSPSFDQFLLLDPSGNIKIASNVNWQGATIDVSVLEQKLHEHHSIALYGLSPLYENEFILVTVQQYKTKSGSALGFIVGITEKKNLQKLIQPLNGLAPLATTYLVLSDQQFIYSKPETDEFILVKSASQNKINSIFSKLAVQTSPQPETLNVTAPNGDASLAQLQWLPEMQTGVVLEVKSVDIYGQLSSLIPFTILLILGSLLATGLVMTFLINRVIKPLRSLSNITRDFADGDWTRRAEILSNDEVGVLASSFNQMADELGKMYHALEQKVDEGERQIRTTAEVAQNITTFSNLNETFNKTVELLVQQFGYYQASIFLMDRSGKYVEFKTGFGSATENLAKKKYRLEVNSASIIGWVSANNQARVASDVQEDPLHLKNELLPETRSEASMPIAIGNLVLGVLDVQSTEAGAFSPETVIMLQTLSSQIATAIQTAGLAETNQVNFEELARLYRSSRLIAEANTKQEILEISSQILTDTPYPVVIFNIQNKQLKVFSYTDATKEHSDANLLLLEFSEASTEEVQNYLPGEEVFATLNSDAIPSALKDIMQKLKLDSAAYLPIRKNRELAAILMIGGYKQNLSNATMQPYINLADLMSITMEKTEAIQQTKKHLRDAKVLASITEAISSSSNQQSFFTTLHGKIREVIGNYNMTVALYDEKENTISIPFSYQDEKISALESYPMGEGLTSILIRTHQPLMLVNDVERQATELGARMIGRPARSWMGAPMLVQNKPIGALIIQDADNEYAFNEEDLKFFIAITGQVAGVINNAHLLEESERRTIQLETAAEIARDISGSLNLDELLVKAVNFIRERFDFYHASIFLHDLQGEFTLIREATGDTGAQMKRAGHKIGIGSNSIVGFVSSRGEQLVVNNTANDVTYYANPLFPDTRSEAAFPLKVGERILGVIDVQSIHPYAFTEDKLRSLQILADQIAIAVVNTELFSETQEHLSQHRLLHHITTTAASGTTLEEALESAVNGLQVTLGGDRVTILLTNREKNTLEAKASTGYAEDITKIEIPIGSGITGWAAAHKRPLRVKNIAEDPRYILVSSNTRSELAIPLVYRNELLGVLNVESELVDAYTENDEEMLGTLGGSLAAIIANARLLEQIRIQAERDRLIYEVTSKIRRSTDIQSIMAATANELTRLTGARYAKIQIKPVDNTKQEES